LPKAGALLNTEPVRGAKSKSDFLSHLQLLALSETARGAAGADILTDN
jgi:hypothetical protein